MIILLLLFKRSRAIYFSPRLKILEMYTLEKSVKRWYHNDKSNCLPYGFLLSLIHPVLNMALFQFLNHRINK